MTTEKIPTIRELLGQSSATAAFKDAVANLEAKNQRSERVTFSQISPPVKVLRSIAWLLEQEPQLAIESVEVDGHSGCSDFVGKMTVGVEGEEAPRVYDFVWDCKWRSDLEGWKDALGYSDQARAAREYGYRCMKSWELVSAGSAVSA